jgi:hypothetical protein
MVSHGGALTLATKGTQKARGHVMGNNTPKKSRTSVVGADQGLIAGLT